MKASEQRRIRDGEGGAFGGPVVASSGVVVLLVALACVVVPVAAVLGTPAGEQQVDLKWLGLLWRTLVACVGVAAVGVVLGWPCARAARRYPVLLPLLFGPMLFPSFLAYAGWSVARSPGTWLGDALGRAASAGMHWIPVTVGKSLGVMALGLWCVPLAAVVLAPGMRAHADAEQALRLEPMSFWRRAMLTWGMHRGAVLSAGFVCVLVALGSALPLHLGQFDTVSIALWRWLSDLPPERWGSLRPMTLPLALVGAVCAAVLWRTVARPMEESQREPGGAGVMTLVWLGVVFALGLVVPVWMLASSLVTAEALWGFWENDGSALLGSLGAGAALGATLSALFLAMLAGWGHRSAWVRRATDAGALVLVAGGLIPGILLGAGVLVVSRRVGIEGPIVELAALVGRFGVVAAVAARWVWLSRPVDSVDLDRLLGGGIRSWWRARGVASLGVAAGVGLVGACLSIHELEAGVMVAEPGSERFAPRLLGYLHYARLDELSAAVLWLAVVTLVPALLAGWLLARPNRARVDPVPCRR